MLIDKAEEVKRIESLVPVPATVTPLPDQRAAVRLHTPQRAVTPGQACVFYQDDLVVGGGWIEATEPAG